MRNEAPSIEDAFGDLKDPCRRTLARDRGPTLRLVLDMAFGEDQCRIRVDNTAQNFAVLRPIVMTLLKRDKTFNTKKRCTAAGKDQSRLPDFQKTIAKTETSSARLPEQEYSRPAIALALVPAWGRRAQVLRQRRRARQLSKRRRHHRPHPRDVH
jgi:hypothetical protein